MEHHLIIIDARGESDTPPGNNINYCIDRAGVDAVRSADKITLIPPPENSHPILGCIVKDRTGQPRDVEVQVI